jgi:hypothetical protein
MLSFIIFIKIFTFQRLIFHNNINVECI